MKQFRKVAHIGLSTALYALFAALALLFGTARPTMADEPNPITAIDICLEPDATMVQHAEAVVLQ